MLRRVNPLASLVIVAPQANEVEALCRRLGQRGFPTETVQVGFLSCTSVPSLDLLIAVGGNGKAQFAVQTQHLLDQCPQAKLLFCAGAAGGLSSDLSIGDVVVGTHTVEHDYRERFDPIPLPRHDSDPGVLEQLRRVAETNELGFRVHFGPIASGDEDIVDTVRRTEVCATTRALCVAWEGSGGARAARFSGVGFVEIRAITDVADEEAAGSFHQNLGGVVPNIADLLVAWRLRVRRADADQ